MSGKIGETLSSEEALFAISRHLEQAQLLGLEYRLEERLLTLLEEAMALVHEWTIALRAPQSVREVRSYPAQLQAAGLVYLLQEYMDRRERTESNELASERWKSTLWCHAEKLLLLAPELETREDLVVWLEQNPDVFQQEFQ